MKTYFKNKLGGGEYKIRRGHNDSRILKVANSRTQTSYRAKTNKQKKPKIVSTE